MIHIKSMTVQKSIFCLNPGGFWFQAFPLLFVLFATQPALTSSGTEILVFNLWISHPG